MKIEKYLGESVFTNTENVMKQIQDSTKSLGSGTYEQLVVKITPDGRKAGWKYSLNSAIGLNFNGVPFAKTGLTLDGLLYGNLIILEKEILTGF